MTKWEELKGRTGHGKNQHATSRFDPVTRKAMSRVAMREKITVSALIYTAVRRLPELRAEIANIKREKRGEQNTPVGRPGHR